MIGIIEDRQTEDAPTFATSNRDIATAIANINLMDSERNIEILRVLNDVFDSIKSTSAESA